MNIFHQLGGRHEILLPLTAAHHQHQQAPVGTPQPVRMDAATAAAAGQHRLVELFWQDRFLPGLMSASAAAAAAAAQRNDSSSGKGKIPLLSTSPANAGLMPNGSLAGALNAASALSAMAGNNNNNAATLNLDSKSKVGNQTNSQDPQAINSRVFVGNLNTFQATKNDIEKMFQPYGRIAGISMHKGYAFVQFTNPVDARSACMGEDGKNVSGQILDVNMVAEPKPHQVGRKRQNVTKTGNDWDFYYDSSYCSPSAVAAALNPAAGNSAQVPRLAPPNKRPRLVVSTSTTSTANTVSNSGNNSPRSSVSVSTPGSTSPGAAAGSGINIKGGLQSSKQAVALDQLKVYSSPDILICGNCREMFSELAEMIDHKKSYCKLRFTCRCESNAAKEATEEGSEHLSCAQCKDVFNSAMELLVHVQTVHSATIYQEGEKGSENGHPEIHEYSGIQPSENHVDTDDHLSSPNGTITQPEDMKIDDEEERLQEAINGGFEAEDQKPAIFPEEPENSFNFSQGNLSAPV